MCGVLHDFMIHVITRTRGNLRITESLFKSLSYIYCGYKKDSFYFPGCPPLSTVHPGKYSTKRMELVKTRRKVEKGHLLSFNPNHSERARERESERARKDKE